MKKLFAIVLVLVLALTLVACGGAGNKKAIVGTWQLVDEAEATEYGLGIEFTKDGKLRYGLTEDVLLGLAEAGGSEISDDEWDEAMEGLDMLMSIEYKVLSDTELEITVSAMFGLAKETTTIPYELKGDTLTFDGATYKRIG